jgi:hypothetical protein
MLEQPDLDRLRQPFPPDAIKQRAGGGGHALSYVEGFTVIRRLNDACPAWDFAILREWQDGNLLKAHVRLTIPGLGSREHVGVQVVNDRPGTEDVQAKGHITDALKKAATLFGVGLELYGPDYEAGEIAAVQRAQSPPPQPATRSGPAIAPETAQRPVAVGVRAAGAPAMTERQRKYLFGLAGEAGLDEDALRERVKRVFGHEHISGMSREDASVLIDALQNGAKPAQPTPDSGASRAPSQPAMAGMPEEPAYLADAPRDWTA